MKNKLKFAVPVLAAVLGAAMPVMAQDNNGGGGGNGGGGVNNNGGGGGGGNNGGGGRNFDPQQWQQRRMDALKEQLGATDDEFSAMQPKVQAVMDAQRTVMAGMRFGRGGPGGGGGGGGGRFGGGGNGGGPGGNNPVSTAMNDLRTTLDNKDAKPEDIKSKLDALRDAKKTARETLTKAQDDLKSVLTQRQEAVMVENNILE